MKHSRLRLQATELLMKGKKKAHGLAVKYYLDKGLSGKMGHKVFTQLMSDGLQVTDIQEGKGVEAKVGDIVKVQYSGKLANGKEFDKGTISFPLGRHKVATASSFSPLRFFLFPFFCICLGSCLSYVQNTMPIHRPAEVS